MYRISMACFPPRKRWEPAGAIAAATRLKPDVALALDMSLAVDIPGVSESRYINELGRGTSIKVMDKLSAALAVSWQTGTLSVK